MTHSERRSRAAQKPRRTQAPPAAGATWMPGDALPCTWMAAGLLAFRLCDREYDCEHCPLDAALAGGAGVTSASSEGREDGPGERLEFRADRHYHASHGWVLPLNATRVRYGLDAFAGRLLDHVSAVVLPPVGSRLRRGDPVCWLEDEAELLPFRSPVSGTVVGANGDTRLDPGRIASAPYDAGWLLEVRGDRSIEDEPGLMNATEARERTTVQLERLRRVRAQALEEDPCVGPTMADGGRPYCELRRILGATRYRRLISELLG